MGTTHQNNQCLTLSSDYVWGKDKNPMGIWDSVHSISERDMLCCVLRSVRSHMRVLTWQRYVMIATLYTRGLQ